MDGCLFSSCSKSTAFWLYFGSIQGRSGLGRKNKGQGRSYLKDTIAIDIEPPGWGNSPFHGRPLRVPWRSSPSSEIPHVCMSLNVTASSPWLLIAPSSTVAVCLLLGITCPYCPLSKSTSRTQRPPQSLPCPLWTQTIPAQSRLDLEGGSVSSSPSL